MAKWCDVCRSDVQHNNDWYPHVISHIFMDTLGIGLTPFSWMECCVCILFIFFAVCVCEHMFIVLCVSTDSLYVANQKNMLLLPYNLTFIDIYISFMCVTTPALCFCFLLIYRNAELSST